MTKSPLKSLQLHAAILAVAYGLLGQTLAVADVRLDMFLKGESDVYFLGFDSAEGTNAAQENGGAAAFGTPAVRLGESELPDAGLVDRTYAVGSHHLIEGSPVNHGDLHADAVDGIHGSTAVTLVDGDATFSVEQSREIGVSLNRHRGSEQKAGELGEHPMPGPTQGAEGQPRTKQEGSGLPGVRREQVPASKEKVCSELGGNVENEVETASSYVVMIPHKVTDSYQKTCNVPVRFVRPGGQGGTADVTWEALDYMGRPWYWDRQCPTGRAYLLRTDDTFFMVDPRFLFKWTGDLTYPDQMAFTRLCGLRFYLNTSRRMFQAVYDGVTA